MASSKDLNNRIQDRATAISASVTMARRLTTEEFIERARAVHGDRYDYSKSVYVNDGTKVTVMCPDHGEFQTNPGAHVKNGRRCPICARQPSADTVRKRAEGIRRSNERKRANRAALFFEKARAKHGQKFGYSKADFVDANTKIAIHCPEHGEFLQSPSSHLTSGCKKCGYGRGADALRKTTEQFISDAHAVHGDRYDYSKVDYKGTASSVCILCSIHGEFLQAAGSHTNGSGCPDCGRTRTTEAMRVDTAHFVARALEVHGDRYDYSKSVYVGSDLPITIRCPDHGEFVVQKANNHYRTGCPTCGEIVRADKRRYSVNQFVELAQSVHGNRYDYSKVDYKNADTDITIICPDHGEFRQKPYNHTTAGNGCEECARITRGDHYRLSASEFVERAREVHGDLYDYSKVLYVNTDSKVTIVDPDYGEFEQTPYKHTNRGQGHPARGLYGYDQTKPGRLYYLRIDDYVFGTLYKIGITNRSVLERFQQRDLEKITIISLWHFSEGARALSRETEILRSFKRSKYKGDDILSSGNSELFTKDILGLDPESGEPLYPIVSEILKEVEEIPLNLDD